MDSFEIQMEFVRERNRIKYENRIMNEEDLISKNSQTVFMQQKQIEMQRKKELEEKKKKEEREELIRLEQIMFEEQIRNERKELELFVTNYIVTRLNKNPRLDVERLKCEAENLFYERLLKIQQDREYENSINRDSRK